MIYIYKSLTFYLYLSLYIYLYLSLSLSNSHPHTHKHCYFISLSLFLPFFCFPLVCLLCYVRVLWICCFWETSRFCLYAHTVLANKWYIQSFFDLLMISLCYKSILEDMSLRKILKWCIYLLIQKFYSKKHGVSQWQPRVFAS